MKVRKYEIDDIALSSIFFCPNCHKQIGLPFKGKLNIKGNLNINCSNCKKGRIIILQKEEVKE